MGKLLNVHVTKEYEYLKRQRAASISSLVVPIIALSFIALGAFLPYILSSSIGSQEPDPLLPLEIGGLSMGVAVLALVFPVIFITIYLVKSKKITFQSFNVPELRKRVLICGIILCFFLFVPIFIFLVVMVGNVSEELMRTLFYVSFGLYGGAIIVGFVIFMNCSIATKHLRGVARRENVHVEKYDTEKGA